MGTKSSKAPTKKRAENLWREMFLPHSLGWKNISCIDADKSYTVETLDAIRNRLVKLRLRSPVVAGIGDRLALLTIGHTGLRPVVNTSSSEWNELATIFWRRYSRSCDVRGMLTLEQIQRLAVSTRPILGGVYVHLLTDGRIELIEPERVRDPQKPKDKSGYINGLKINRKTGEIVAYCVHSRDEYGAFSGPHDEIEIPAQEMLAVTTPTWRPDQLRELPDLASCEAMLHDLDDLNRRVVKTARVQSGIIGTMVSQVPITAARLQSRKTVADDATRNIFEFDWGLLLKGQGGEDIRLLSSPTPSQNYAPHIKLQYTLIGAALGIPYEVLMLDMSNLTYSGAKAVLLQAKNAMKVWRTWIIARLLQPLWRWRIARAIADKELPPAPTDQRGISEWARVEWYCEEPLWADRHEEARANVYDLQMCTTNPIDMAARIGSDANYNAEKTAQFLAYVKQLAEKYGVNAQDIYKAIMPGQASQAKTTGEEENETDESS